jgi:hypothetical protein
LTKKTCFSVSLQAEYKLALSGMSHEHWSHIFDRVSKLADAKPFLAPLPLFDEPSYLSRIAPSKPLCVSEACAWLASEGSNLGDALRVIRTPFLNALRYNTLLHVGNIRASAVKLLRKIDEMISKNIHLCLELQQSGRPFAAALSAFPESFACQEAFEAFIKEPGTSPEYPAVFSFYYPLASYFPLGREDPVVVDYYARVPSPTCLADCAARLYSGEFASLSDFRGAVNLVFENAKRYSSADVAAAAPLLYTTFETLLHSALSHGGKVPASAVTVASKSLVAAPLRPSSVTKMHQHGGSYETGGAISKAEAKRCLDVLYKLDQATLTSEITHIKVRLSEAFHYPVERLVQEFPEYSKVIANPIDLNIIRKKLEHDPADYATVKEFSADVRLMVHNCEVFNAGEESYETRLVAEKLWEKFKVLFSDQFAGYELAHSPAKYAPGQTSHSAGRVPRSSATQHRAGHEKPRHSAEEDLAVAAPASKIKLKLAARPTGTVVPALHSSIASTSGAAPLSALPLLDASASSIPGRGVIGASDAAATSAPAVIPLLPPRPPTTVRLKLRVTREPSAEWTGPRTLFDFPLATNKALQVRRAATL